MRGFRIKFRSEELLLPLTSVHQSLFFTIVRTVMNYRLPVAKALEMTPWILFG